MKQDVLTAAEARVVRLVSLGCTTRQTAAILELSPNTVDNHRWRSMQKLGVHSLASLMRAALSLGITSLEDRLTEAESSKAANCGRVDQPTVLRPAGARNRHPRSPQ